MSRVFTLRSRAMAKDLLAVICLFSTIVFIVLLTSGSKGPIKDAEVAAPEHILRHVTSEKGLECVRWVGGGLSCNWDKFNKEKGE